MSLEPRADSYDYNGGWALRAPSCSDQSASECGATTNPFHACCSGNGMQSCPSAYNAGCCPYQSKFPPLISWSALFAKSESISDSTCNDGSSNSILEVYPKCADPSWTLCDGDGYFCCPKDYVCYSILANNGSGCGVPGYRVKAGKEVVLATLIPADYGPGGSLAIASTIFVSGREVKTKTNTNAPSTKVSTTSSISSSPTIPAGANATATGNGAPITNSTSNGGGTNIGAIVGGVIGAVVLLILAAATFFFYRRKKQNGQHTPLVLQPDEAKRAFDNPAGSGGALYTQPSEYKGHYQPQTKHELDNNTLYTEIGSSAHQTFEMDGSSRTGELDTHSAGTRQNYRQ